MGQCPSCKKQISDNANICWFCQKVIRVQTAQTAKKKIPWESTVIKLLIVAILVVVILRIVAERTTVEVEETVPIESTTVIDRSGAQTIVSIGLFNDPISLYAEDKTVLLQKNDWEVTLEQVEELAYKEYYVAYNLGTVPPSNDERAKNVLTHMLLILPITDQRQIQTAKKYTPQQRSIPDTWENGVLKMEYTVEGQDEFDVKSEQLAVEKMTEDASFLMFPATLNVRKKIAQLNQGTIVRVKGVEYKWTRQTYQDKLFAISPYSDQLKVMYVSEISKTK